MNQNTKLLDNLTLITTERLKDRQAVHEIFSKANRPPWVKGIESPYPERDYEPDEPALAQRIVLLGEAHKRQFFFTIIGLATGYEFCRLGHTWGTNDNHSATRNVYAQMIFDRAFRANLPVARLFTDAGPGKIVKTEGRPYDLTADNLALIPGPRAAREARAVALGHAERLAREHPERLPNGVTVDGYMENLVQLLTYHDELSADGEV